MHLPKGFLQMPLYDNTSPTPPEALLRYPLIFQSHSHLRLQHPFSEAFHQIHALIFLSFPNWKYQILVHLPSPQCLWTYI